MKNKVKNILNKLTAYLFKDLINNQNKFAINQIITNSISKGNLSCCSRIIDETNPISWEFSAFSQNSEDGIIDFLTKKIQNPNKYFIEVGSSKGVENNTAYLAYVQKFSGLMIDGNPQAIKIAESICHNMGVKYHSQFINLNNIETIKEISLFNNPDLFSWDTDGNDYYFVKKVFEIGYKPKIFIVEYNSAFGPDEKISVQYDENFSLSKAHKSQLYYGCSVALWKDLFKQNNYSFVTVDSNGVNAVFINNDEFDKTFIQNICGKEFVENFYQFKKFGQTWQNQFNLIKNMPFYKPSK